MSLRIFYHNITKNTFNETCVIDLIDDYTEGDAIYYSEAGNALVHKLELNQLNTLIEEHKVFNEDEDF